MSVLTSWDLYYGDEPCDRESCDEVPIFEVALEGRDGTVPLCSDHAKKADGWCAHDATEIEISVGDRRPVAKVEAVCSKCGADLQGFVGLEEVDR